jgi:hypothetical protein
VTALSLEGQSNLTQNALLTARTGLLKEGIIEKISGGPHSVWKLCPAMMQQASVPRAH